MHDSVSYIEKMDSFLSDNNYSDINRTVVRLK